MVKHTTPTPTEDEVRDAILKLLYDKWKNPSGMDTAKVKISETRKILKAKGIGQKEVIRNLQYLVKTKWVDENVKKYSYNTGKFSIPNESKSYSISSQGIDYIDGRSKFEKREGMAGIRIDNVSGIVVVGDNNYTRQEFFNLFKSLDELNDKIKLTNELTDEKKIEYSAEVKTIQDQLAKPKPDKGIVSKAWGALKFVGTIGSVANVWEKAKTALEQAFGSLSPPM